jgi:hypothetical protein
MNTVTRSNAVSHDHFPIPFPSAFLGVLAKLRKATIRVVMLVHPQGIWPPLYGFSWNLIIWTFFENLLRKFNFLSNLTRIMGILHEDQRTFKIISHSIFLSKWEMFQTTFVEKIKTHIWCSIRFSPENRTVWDMCENKVESDRLQVTIKCGACAMHAG